MLLPLAAAPEAETAAEGSRAPPETDLAGVLAPGVLAGVLAGVLGPPLPQEMLPTAAAPPAPTAAAAAAAAAKRAAVALLVPLESPELLLIAAGVAAPDRESAGVLAGVGFKLPELCLGGLNPVSPVLLLADRPES